MKPGEIEQSYNESFYFLNERKIRQVNQLVLLNNLNRGDQNIASTLLLTLFNRMVSSTYDDKLQVKFLPSQGINQEQLNAYNILAQSDYQEMEKARLDYDWTWDTLFFGRGYCETIRFDKKRKIMQPHVINPLVFGYDPYFENPQDWRYYWKWVTKSKNELQRLIKAGKLDIESTDEIPSGIDPYIWNYKVKRDAAKKVTQPPIQPAQSDVFQILEFFGHNEEGKKCVYWIDKQFSTILLESELDLKDGEPIILPDGSTIEGESRWPVVVKEAFREPHSSVNFSVADILEDKHRAKSVLLNLAYIAAKDRANPLYWYDPDKIKDISQFLSRQVNQHIPVEGDGSLAVGPLNTEDPMSQGLIQFITMLDNEAEEPMGAGKPMQPTGSKGAQTATQAAIDQQLNDLAQSLQSKVMQFGEKEFWSHWFARYSIQGAKLGQKMANIVGVKGIETSIIDLGLFSVKFPPGVIVYSAKEAEYKEMILRRDLQEMLPILSTTMDPDGLRNFYKHVLMPKYLQDPSLIDIMFPDTLDEMKANDENEILAKNEFIPAQETDNHITHIYTHHMVQPKTWAVWMHIAMHEEMLAQGQVGGKQGGGQQQEQKVSESISYKDLPPDGQVQMAAQAGIKIDEQAVQQMQQQQKTQPAQTATSKPPNKSANKPPGQSPQSMNESAVPLKQAMSTSSKPLKSSQISNK